MILNQDNEYTALLDASVLVPMALCDTLLRLAEGPAQYRPIWSDKYFRRSVARWRARSVNSRAARLPHWNDAHSISRGGNPDSQFILRITHGNTGPKRPARFGCGDFWTCACHRHEQHQRFPKGLSRRIRHSLSFSKSKRLLDSSISLKSVSNTRKTRCSSDRHPPTKGRPAFRIEARRPEICRAYRGVFG